MYCPNELVTIQCRMCGYQFFRTWTASDTLFPLLCPECGSHEITCSGEEPAITEGEAEE